MKTILDFQAYKKNHQKITMITCYDYAFAKILNETEMDILFIGDSIAQVIYGYPTTLHATISMMAEHTSAVSRGAPSKFILTDMPFLATRKGIKHAVESAGILMKAGAHAIKIEGVKGMEKLIKHLVQSGIPVMGHLGLTPQSIHQLGGHKIQGRDEASANDILNDALCMEKVGCFGVLLECIPAMLCEKITQRLSIPTIGIGAGQKASGQVLVLQDMLGINTDFKPKFLKHYMHGKEAILSAVNQYIKEVRQENFPSKEHVYD